MTDESVKSNPLLLPVEALHLVVKRQGQLLWLRVRVCHASPFLKFALFPRVAFATIVTAVAILTVVAGFFPTLATGRVVIIPLFINVIIVVCREAGLIDVFIKRTLILCNYLVSAGAEFLEFAIGWDAYNIRRVDFHQNHFVASTGKL